MNKVPKTFATTLGKRRNDKSSRIDDMMLPWILANSGDSPNMFRSAATPNQPTTSYRKLDHRVDQFLISQSSNHTNTRSTKYNIKGNYANIIKGHPHNTYILYSYPNCPVNRFIRIVAYRYGVSLGLARP